MNRRLAAALTALLVVNVATAADEAAHHAATVLKAARLFDGKSGKLVQPGLLVIEGDHIVGVGPGAKIPADARTVDLGDATLLVRRP